MAALAFPYRGTQSGDGKWLPDPCCMESPNLVKRHTASYCHTGVSPQGPMATHLLSYRGPPKLDCKRTASKPKATIGSEGRGQSCAV